MPLWPAWVLGGRFVVALNCYIYITFGFVLYNCIRECFSNCAAKSWLVLAGEQVGLLGAEMAPWGQARAAMAALR